VLKNLRIKANNIEYKISELGDNLCRTQKMFSIPMRIWVSCKFSLKNGKDSNGKPQIIEITVYNYFKLYKGIELPYSSDFSCINVGKPKLPTYFPVEASEGVLICLLYLQLIVGNKESFIPRGGPWNFNNKGSSLRVCPRRFFRPYAPAPWRLAWAARVSFMVDCGGALVSDLSQTNA
ncbi:hypothetical protein S83_015441, partial [Arachis hypogaea]